jgi:putative ABC transport system permease protein
MFRRERVERELDEELAYHFDREVEQNMARGMSVEAARAAARRALGALDLRKEECRENWAVAALDKLGRDVRHACRTLRRDVGFTIGVFVLLALGIGANVAMFSIVDAVLIEPLPYPRPDRLVAVREMTPRLHDRPRSVNALHYHEWRECSCFEGVALLAFVGEVNLAGEGDPERVPTQSVTPNTFAVLGVDAQLGRTFLAEDAEPGREIALISDALWRRNFSANPQVLGRTISLDGVQAEIVGVLPAGFRNGARVDVYRPWSAAPMPWWNWNNNHSYFAVARLADGVSAAAALEQMNAIQAGIAAEHFQGEFAGWTLLAVFTPLHEFVTGSSRAGLILLLVAVAAALVVACLNIANLMLVRATARSREAGVRAALGASRLAIFRGVLIESVLLATAGAIAGVGVSAAALEIFTSVAGATLPRADEVRLDGTALMVALVLAFAATVAVGLVPAFRMTGVDPQEALREGSRAVTDSPRRQRFTRALVTLEVALSVSLLTVAGLLLTSFARLDAVERGFEPSNVLTAEVSLPRVRYPTDDGRIRFYGALLRELDAHPGVVAAGVTSSLPLTGSNWGSTVNPEGVSLPPEQRLLVEYRFVSPGYLEAMGIPLMAGRSVEAQDDGRLVAVLSEGVARRFWSGREVIGRRFYRGNPDEAGDLFEIIGLVPDVHSVDLATEPKPLVYVPLRGRFEGAVFPTVSIAARTEGDPAMAAAFVRNTVASLDRELAVSKIRTMSEIESASLDERRFQLILAIAFGAASLLIAALGTYSVVAYDVARRAHDISMRMALGADARRVVVTVLKHGMQPVVLGVIAGVGGALLFGRYLTGLLFAVSPWDPVTLASVAGVTLVAALLASWLPARRASRVSPLDTLRHP